MGFVDTSFLDQIQVTFYSEIDRQIYPVSVNWASVLFKEIVLGSDEKAGVQIQAPLIPLRWLSIQINGSDFLVDFSVLSGPSMTLLNGDKIQEGSFYMPQTLSFVGLGELRFKKNKLSTASSPPPDPSIATTPKGLIKERYRILRILGEGGFSHVALALDEVSGKEVAIKVIHHKVSDDLELKAKIIDRFFQEMTILIQLKHPNVTRILDYGFDDGTWFPFYVMEFVNGKSLVQVSAQFTGDDQWDVADLLLDQFLKGLSYLHQQGVIHRDLKPENILVSGVYPDFQIKILDLGLAKMLNLKSYEHLITDTQELETFGTPPYMSPEQCLNAKIVTAASDVYSAGILICILYCNQYPYEINENQSYEQIHLQEIPSFNRIKKIVPESIFNMLQKSLEKKPEDRFQNAHEMFLFWQNQESKSFQRKWKLQIKSLQEVWIKYFFLVLTSLLVFVLLWIYFFRYILPH